MNDTRTLPRWAESIIRHVTPAEDADDVVAELHDEYKREITIAGSRSARTWLMREVLGSVLPLAARRVTIAFRTPRQRGTVRNRFETILFDLSYAVRQLRRAPAFTVTVMIAFALGIGANATMFGIVDELMFKPLSHVRAPEEIVTLAAGTPEQGYEQRTLNFPVYAAIREYNVGFSHVAAVADIDVPLGRGVNATSLEGLLVTASYFTMLGVTPLHGRFFTIEEDVAPLGQPVAVISHAFWQRHFSGNRNAIGARLHLGDREFTVIGISPRGFTGVEYVAPDVWLPMSSGGAMNFFAKSWSTESVATWLRIYARTKPGFPVSVAETDATRIAREAAPGAFFTQTGWGFRTRPIQAARSEERGASGLVAVTLGGMSLIVLVIACANVANLLLARGIRRRREMAVRLALGISTGRLMRQLLTESVLLATLGGAASIIVANWGGVVARRLLMSEFSSSASVIDTRLLLFIAAVVVLVGIFTGLVPALQARHAEILSTLGAAGDRGSSRRLRSQSVLLALQAALSLVLLVGAGLFGRSMIAINSQRMGVDIDRVFLGSMNLRSIGRSTSEVDAVFSRALEQVSATPGVSSAAIAVTFPFGPSFGAGIAIRGADSMSRYNTMYNIVTPRYFETLGAKLKQGREFTISDNEKSLPVVIVNEMLAHRAWGAESPIGRCVNLGSQSGQCVTVVGVVENIRRQSIFEDSSNFIYVPLAQGRDWIGTRHLVARAAGESGAVADRIRLAMQTAAPDLPFADVRLVKDQPIVREETLPFRLGSSMLGGFGALALLLAAVGVYGVISYDVSQRTRELGIRMALGARTANVWALIMRDGIRVVASGAVAGIGIALAGGRFVQPMLYATSPRDPVVLSVVALVLLVVATIACLVPAQRATRVNINAAIRDE